MTISLVILISIISLFILYLMNNNQKEHFCPTNLTNENGKFILWNGKKVIAMFNNYSDYLKYYHSAQSGYTNKCKQCNPLKAINSSHLKTSPNAMEKNWADTSMSTKWFNIEYFANSNTIRCGDSNKEFTLSDDKKSIILGNSKLLYSSEILSTLCKHYDLKSDTIVLKSDNSFIIFKKNKPDVLVKYSPNGKILYVKNNITSEESVNNVVVQEEENKMRKISIATEETSTQKCLCYNDKYSYDEETNSCINSDNKTKRSICSETSIKPNIESVVVEEETSSPRDKLIKLISKTKNAWLNNQPKCVQKITSKDKSYYSKLINAYGNYMHNAFKASLGYVPDVDSEDKMSYTELSTFYKLIKNLPKCELLIQKHYKTIDTTKAPVVSTTTIKNNSISNTLSTPSSIISSVVNTQPIIDNNAGDIDSVANRNRGQVASNPQGERRLEPETAPYLKYVKDIGNRLNKIEVKISSMNDPKKQTQETIIETMKYLNQAKNIQQKIKDDKSILEEEKRHYQKSNTKDFSLLSHNSPENAVVDNEHKNFVYKNPHKFNHIEPSKTIASAYGWSYMPPQYWSVPQKRPPVCIPEKVGAANVKPMLDEGVPVDALDWTQVGSILPKFEYNEVHNPDYFYPGWKSQKAVNYPKMSGGKNLSTEYYNNNRATPTK